MRADGCEKMRGDEGGTGEGLRQSSTKEIEIKNEQILESINYGARRLSAEWRGRKVLSQRRCFAVFRSLASTTLG